MPMFKKSVPSPVSSQVEGLPGAFPRPKGNFASSVGIGGGKNPPADLKSHGHAKGLMATPAKCQPDLGKSRHSGGSDVM